MRRTTSKSLFASIQAAREQVPPQADAALAATEKARIAARVFRCALEASHQADVSTLQSTSHARNPHSELPQCARGFLAKDVACRRRRDALTCKQNNAFGTFGREIPRMYLRRPRAGPGAGDPPSGLTAFSRGSVRPLNCAALMASTVCERLVLLISTCSSTRTARADYRRSSSTINTSCSTNPGRACRHGPEAR